MYSYPHKTAYRKLENISFRDYVHTLSGAGHSLYLHIPFCESKCGYCNLFSVTGLTDDFFEKYTSAVIRQIKQFGEIIPADTVFEDITVGGGTPLLMNEHFLGQIFENIFRYLPVREGGSLIIETAPEQTTEEKVRFLKSLGVTRVSMGIQSFDDSELKWLRRYHSSESALRAASVLNNSGFKCLNFDFIYGLPSQTEKSLISSLRKALEFSPDEIFLYPLYIKHGVKLMSEKNVPDPEHTFRLYECGRRFLNDNGFFQSSMRRFTKEKNTSFSECGMKSSISLGCGGRSYLGNLHACTPYRTDRCSAVTELESFISTEDYMKINHGIILDDDELRRRYAIRHAFILPGISTEVYRERFKRKFTDDFPVFKKWIQEGYFSEKDGMITLTETGMGLSDMLGPELISEKIKNRMLEWEIKNG